MYKKLSRKKLILIFLFSIIGAFQLMPEGRANPMEPPQLSLALIRELSSPRPVPVNIEGWSIYNIDPVANWLSVHVVCRTIYDHPKFHINNIWGISPKDEESKCDCFQPYYFTTIQPLTKKPVQLTESNRGFFKELTEYVPFDGSKVGYKFVFLPDFPGISYPRYPVVQFFAIKDISNTSDEEYLTSAPSIQQEDEEINKRMRSLEYYHKSTLEYSNENKRIEYLNKSAELDFPVAQFVLARHYYFGEDESKKNKALELFRRSADQGHVLAQYYYSEMLEEYSPLNSDEYLNKFLDFEKNPINRLLSETYRSYEWDNMSNRGLDHSNDLSYETLKNLVRIKMKYTENLDDVYYQFALHNNSLKTEKFGNLWSLYSTEYRNSKVVRHYFKLAAKKGHAKAQYQYGMMLNNADGGVINLELARENLRRAAKQGLGEAQYQYGLMLKNGKGGEIDLDLARENIRLAGEQGIVEAEAEYAGMLGGERDPKVVRRFYEGLTNKGNWKLDLKYAVMLRYGDFGPQNVPLARRIFHRIAREFKNAEAQYHFAELLTPGHVFGDSQYEKPVFSKVRVTYMRLAAENGYPPAQCDYGIMLIEGREVKQDSALGLRFLKKAAKNNYSYAKEKLEQY